MEGAELDVLDKVQDAFEDTLGDMGLADEDLLSRMEASSLTANIPLYQAPFSLYPVFEMIHFLITAAKIRTDYGQEFAWTRPLASLASVLISCVAGSILTNLLLGIPVAAAFKSETYLLMIIASWAGVFFCPQDIIFKLVQARPVYCLLWCFKEVDRMKKIVVGVDQAAGLHPDNVMVTALCGVLRGAGTSIIRPLVTTMMASSEVTSAASSSELTSPSLVTKLCWLAALTWVTVIRCPPDLLPAPGLYNAWVMVFLAVRLDALLGLSNMFGENSEDRNAENNNEEQTLKEETNIGDLEEKKTD